MIRTEFPQGQVEQLAVASKALANNPWGDPTHRVLNVYLPADYMAGVALPVLWYLAAFTNSGAKQFAWRGFDENLPQRLDRLIAKGDMPPAIVAAPDCFTTLGGNQYVNSPSVGNYADHVVEELLPLVEERFSVQAHGVLGKSSGGFGALHLALANPGVFDAVACQSGDMGFDLVYQRDFADAATTLACYDYEPHAFLRDFWAGHARRSSDFQTLLLLAMAASYDPDLEQPTQLTLPFDVTTLEVDADAWARWLAFDPVQRSAAELKQLAGLRCLYIDCGRQDQYALQYGAQRFSNRLQQLNVDHQLEFFAGSHSGIDHRLDQSLPLLATVLSL